MDGGMHRFAAALRFNRNLNQQITKRAQQPVGVVKERSIINADPRPKGDGIWEG